MGFFSIDTCCIKRYYSKYPINLDFLEIRFLRYSKNCYVERRPEYNMVLISTQTARFRDRPTQQSGPIRVPFFFAFEVQNPNNRSIKYLGTYLYYYIGYVPANVNCYKDKIRQIDG